ncbi:protein PLANT CADMIUM RESISTANCE 2-like [Elaeis guineensis]|uniref:protein PLANT CADMIUM RESISTANCE 2-like n=1 Tax=Elaeis guineensis var. tenera TaxID=51953 RepID=UPI00057B67B0
MDPSKAEGYHTPPSPSPATAPSLATAIPATSLNQVYPPSCPAPATLQVQSKLPTPWSTGLFDCCDDVGNCCVTCFCPCVTFGQVAEIVDQGSISCAASGALYALIFCVTGCNCLYSCFYRSKMRGQFFLEESPCADCLVHCCCEMCALCQEYRELKCRGFDLHSGREGNLGRQSATLPPVIEGGMSR